MAAVPRFDATIHPPARLQLMAVLANVQEVEFAALRDTVKVSDSVLSKHLGALAVEGYVTLRKAASGGRQRTWASITGGGRRAFREHVRALQAIAAAADLPMAAE